MSGDIGDGEELTRLGFRRRPRYERLPSGDERQYSVELEELPSYSAEGANANTFNTDINKAQTKRPTTTFDELLPRPSSHRPSIRSSIHRTKTTRQRFFSGWRVGATAATFTACSAFLINVGITIFVWRNPKFPVSNHIGTLAAGSCTNVKNQSRWMHLAINSLSTILLCCSNYCMQYLNSPNRDELVRAHGKRRWLHIGVPNTRNLWDIGWDRTVLWVLLAVSSMPLHLLYNSTIFNELQANQYDVVTASESFLSGSAYNTSGILGTANSTTGSSLSNIIATAESLRDRFNNGSLQHQNLTTRQCFSAYENQYVSKYGSVLLIQNSTVWHDPTNYFTNWTSATNYTWLLNGTVPQEDRPNWSDQFPFHSSPDKYPSNGWRCSSRNVTTCDLVDAAEMQDLDQWAPYGSPVKYCLAELVDEKCKLQFSFDIAIVVIVCNLVKAVCMACTLLKQRKPALVTLGDAIASFLDEPDPTTEARCLYDKEEFGREWHWSWQHEHEREAVRTRAMEFHSKQERWANASSIQRWVLTYISYIMAFIFAAVMIQRSLIDMPTSIKGLWRTGVGQLTGNNLLSFGTSLIGGVVVANLPQAVLSYLYLSFNALVTVMLVAEEYSHYFLERKTLRVTSPSGHQRSTYWLHVPWTYGLPLTALSGLIHWLASQSIFMVQIDITSLQGTEGAAARKSVGSISTCGYSPIAVIFTTIVGLIIVVGGVVLAMRKYPSGMPLAGSCSAAISAACHPPENDVDAAVLPVQWGVVSVDGDGVDRVGHCTFTSLGVEQPIPGKLYA